MVDKFAEATEDSKIICKSCNCVEISNDENDVETKGENEAVVCCITKTKFEEVEISIDKDLNDVEVNDGMVNMHNVDEDDKFLKCEDTKDVFVQKESLKDMSMKKFNSCIESDDCAHIGTIRCCRSQKQRWD